MAKFTEADTWKTRCESTQTCLGKLCTHAPHFTATFSFHCTAQEKQILSTTPEPWLFLPLMVMLDPGYRNVK